MIRIAASSSTNPKLFVSASSTDDDGFPSEFLSFFLITNWGSNAGAPVLTESGAPVLFVGALGLSAPALVCSLALCNTDAPVLGASVTAWGFIKLTPLVTFVTWV